MGWIAPALRDIVAESLADAYLGVAALGYRWQVSQATSHTNHSFLERAETAA